MEIRTADDLKNAAPTMHDSEFTDQDFGLDEETRVFHLESVGIDTPREVYRLELHNVVAWNPVHLDKVRQGKAVGGVFNYIHIKRGGRRIAIISQDLRIELELTSLEGCLSTRMLRGESQRRK